MRKSKGLSKFLSMIIAIAMILSVISVGMIASAAQKYDPNKDHYGAGDQVEYNGVIYEAKWWTNSTPGSDESWSMVGSALGVIDENSMKNDSETMPNNNYRVVGYVTQWGWPGTYDVETDTAVADIDVSKLTHINYAFGHVATLDSKGNAFPGYIDIPDPGKLHALVDLKKQNPDLKILISIGGWGADGFSIIAADAAKTAVFAKSCKQIMDEFGIDGIDIDWEYPGTNGDHLDVLHNQYLKTPIYDEDNKFINEVSVYQDGMNYIKLLKAVREQVGWDHLVTIATGVGYDWMCAASIGELPDWLDFINIMCYDLYGDWDSNAMYNAPLYNAESDNPLSYNTVCERLAYRGYPRDIMNIGIPYYGREKVMGSGDASWITFREVQELKNDPNATVHWDSTACASYLQGNIHGREYDITYDDVRDIEVKMEWIQDEGYGGAMFWEYSQDDAKKTLTNAIWENLNGNSRKVAPPTPSYRFDGTKAGFTTGLKEPTQEIMAPIKGQGTNTIWQSWRNYIGNHPDVVFYGGYSWARIDNENNQKYTWMACNHQGTFGWAPAYAPLFAQKEYHTPEGATGEFDVTYPAEWSLMTKHEETFFDRNEAGKLSGKVNPNVLKVESVTPRVYQADTGATVSWDVDIAGGTGSYTVTNEIWFSALKFNQDGSVKTEKRRTGGPYPLPTADARTNNKGEIVQKEVQEGDKMDKITPIAGATSTGDCVVTARFPEDGMYYVYTVVTDSSGTVASVYSQGVQIGEGLVVSPETATLQVGETLKLTANKPVTAWVSSDIAVAYVSNDGIVTAKADGVCTITATAGDSGQKGSATITVGKGGTITPPPSTDVLEYAMKLEATKAYNNGVLEDTNESIIQGTAYKAKLQLDKGKTFLPARSVAEAIGLTVGYDAATSYSTVTDGKKTVKIIPNSTNIIVVENGISTTVNTGTAPIYVKGVTHIPVRAVIEQFGFFVNWHSDGYLLITDYELTGNDIETLKAKVAKML